MFLIRCLVPQVVEVLMSQNIYERYYKICQCISAESNLQIKSGLPFCQKIRHIILWSWQTISHETQRLFIYMLVGRLGCYHRYQWMWTYIWNDDIYWRPLFVYIRDQCRYVKRIKCVSHPLLSFDTSNCGPCESYLSELTPTHGFLCIQNKFWLEKD
jgi:hypothetical protein